jgi:hypothetical protein
MFKAFMKHGHVFPQISSNTKTPLKDIYTQGKSTTITSHIPSLTHIPSSFELHGSKVVNVEDLKPIEPEEMPSSDLFFNKKRKDIVQREIQKKGGVITKRKKVIFDVQGQSDPKFEKRVADSLGDFATTNLWSVENLRDKIDQKNILIEQLQNDLKQTEETVKE